MQVAARFRWYKNAKYSLENMVDLQQIILRTPWLSVAGLEVSHL